MEGANLGYRATPKGISRAQPKRQKVDPRKEVEMLHFLWELLRGFSDVMGVLGAIAAAMAWLTAFRTRKEAEEREALLNTPISIILQNEETGEELALPYRPPRRKLDRGSLLGILGMFRPDRRYNIPDLPLIFIEGGEWEPMEKGLTDKIRIQVPSEEFKAFEEGVKALLLKIKR